MVEKSEEIPLSEEEKEMLSALKPSDISKIIERYRDLYAKAAELERQVEYWKKQYILLEESFKHVNAEMEGLLESKTEVKQLAGEMFLSFQQLFQKFDKAAQYFLKGKLPLIWSQLAGIIAIVTPFIFFYAIKDWLTSPQNQLFFLLVISLIFGIAYMSKK